MEVVMGTEMVGVVASPSVLSVALTLFVSVILFVVSRGRKGMK
jgi:hypothetical protein